MNIVVIHMERATALLMGNFVTIVVKRTTLKRNAGKDMPNLNPGPTKRGIVMENVTVVVSPGEKISSQWIVNIMKGVITPWRI